MDWYYEENGLQVGPLTDEEFQVRVHTGQVQATTLVWNETLTGWKEYASLSATGSRPSFVATANQVAAQCSQCHRVFPEDEMLRYQSAWICAECKPAFFQHLKEAGSVPGIYQYGGFWIRFVAKFVDYVIVGVAYGLLGVLFAGINSVSPEHPEFMFLYVFVLWGLEIAIWLGYSILFVGKYSATPGKMLTSLRIMTADGEPMDYPKAAVRCFAEIVSGLTCNIGYIMAAFDEEKRSLHDRIANTRVVRK